MYIPIFQYFKHVVRLSSTCLGRRHLFSLVISVATPLVACGGGGDSKPRIVQSSPSATLKPSPIPTSGPEPTSSPTAIPTPSPTASSPPDKQITVYFFSTEPVSTDTVPSDCTSLSKSVSELTIDPEIVGPDISQEIRDFSALWLTENGWIKGDEDMELVTTPTKLYAHSLSSVILNEAEWLKQPSMGAHDLGKASLIAECTVIAELEYVSTGLNLILDDSTVNWISEKAAQNQIYYDDETTSDIFRAILGASGLAYGEYVKAGIYLDHVVPILSRPNSFHRFSLLWVTEEVSGKALAMQKIPQGVRLAETTNWSDSCQTIKLRVASTEDFSDASIWVINRQADCGAKPIFRTGESKPIPENSMAEFQTFLRATEKLHFIMFPLDEVGLPIKCDEREPVAFDGCSQPIVQSFQSHLVDFFANKSDLFIEINFSDRIVKQYRANTLSGEVEDIGSRILQ